MSIETKCSTSGTESTVEKPKTPQDQTGVEMKEEEQTPIAEKPSPTIVPNDSAEGDNDDGSDNSDDEEVKLNSSMIQSLPTPPNPQTYLTTKFSQFYTLAKADLQTGDFEAALSKIERGITALLEIHSQTDLNNDTAESDSGELHESLAPLYYLYGTTLLYSVEESRGENPEDGVVGPTASADDSAEDIQIAWENLESARSILHKVVEAGKGSSELVMDLAQVHSRLGDLSRHNGHYEDAVRDYNLCRTQRMECLSSDDGGGIWDRRIADVEYSLGMTCLLLASEGEKNLSNTQDNTPSGFLSAATKPNPENPPNESKVNLSPEEIQSLRDDSIRHYLQCGRVLGGMIGVACGKDPSATGEVPAGRLSIDYGEQKPSAAAAASVESSERESLCTAASRALQTVRERVKHLKPASLSEEAMAQIEDLRETLDEIQETIDTCETDREGLGVVNEMRKKAEELVAKQDEVDGGGKVEDGGVTTIGFGGSSSDSCITGTTTEGFSGVASKGGLNIMAKPKTVGEQKSANPVPMMVIKKKKKKAAVVESTLAGNKGNLKRVRIE